MQDNRVVTILGRKRQGKTLLLGALIVRSRRVVALDPIGRFSLPAVCPTMPAVWAAVKADRRAAFRVRVPVRSVAEAETAVANAYGVGGCLLAIDELGLWWSASTDRGALFTAVMVGGNRGLDIAANVRRPAEFPRAFTSQTDVWCIFNTQEPLDLAYIRQATRPDIADVCRTLPRLSFVQYVCGEGGYTIRKLIIDTGGHISLQ